MKNKMKEKKDENYIGGVAGKSLSIFCVDSVDVKARVTFNSCIIDGLRLTYWYEEPEDSQQVIDDMFCLLFEEVERIREENQAKIKNSD